MSQPIKAIYEDGVLKPATSDSGDVIFTLHVEGPEEMVRQIVEEFIGPASVFIPEEPLTDEELAELLKPDPKTGREIVEKWVDQQRHKGKERTRWSLD